MIMGTLDLILAPWSTPEQFSWNLQIAVMGTMVCLSCGIVGTFIVIRRMALLGDAISHGILPGIVIAYLLTGSLSICLLYTSPSPRDLSTSRMPSSA